MPTRRTFLTTSFSAAVSGSLARFSPYLEAAQAPAAIAGGRLLGTLPLAGDDAPPTGRLLGSGLDARLITDLAALSEDALVTPTDRFFIRTARPAALDLARPWTIAVGGLVAQPQTLTLASLAPLARPQGRCLLECSGNRDPSSYGLLSAAEWDGIPIAAVLDRVRPSAPGTRVLVSGVDDPRETSSSLPGASWIFSRDDLANAGAFLATGMNGAPLPVDHGLPVRLVVPGWYGCTCIKWVDRIELVPDTVAATTQMQEFAERTHQQAGARLARDFTPAVIDTAATAIRVEKWLVAGRLVYRVAGVLWGGSTPPGPTNALSIRFKGGTPWVNVDHCPMPATTRTWTLWSHQWRPAEPGRYQIVLRIDNPAIRTRRLDVFFYVREVTVDEV